MFFIVIPKCMLINEELNGYIKINNTNNIIMIENYSFIINGYLFYQIFEELKNINYEIYNYNQKRIYSNFSNISVIIKENKKIYSNNVIEITHYINESYILIKATETKYLCKKMYFNKNKEFIIEEKFKTIPSFETNYIISI